MMSGDLQRRLDELTTALRANPSLIQLADSADADIIAPVHDAPAQFGACVASIARHTHRPFRLIVIDDGSTDSETHELLDALTAVAPAATVVRRLNNLGFVRTVNDGLSLSSAPLAVILNSDTVVTDRWLDKLIEVSRSRPNIATVTPLTNNGTICSVPRMNEPNDLPVGYDIDTFAGLVEQRSLRRFPEAPTGVGFCMLTTRAAIDAVGMFDAETFGAGYGEENDFLPACNPRRLRKHDRRPHVRLSRGTSLLR
jgi:GT2 family glycosyltransferase